MKNRTTISQELRKRNHSFGDQQLIKDLETFEPEYISGRAKLYGDAVVDALAAKYPIRVKKEIKVVKVRVSEVTELTQLDRIETSLKKIIQLLQPVPTTDTFFN